jgi:hypothetical protein
MMSSSATSSANTMPNDRGGGRGRGRGARPISDTFKSIEEENSSGSTNHRGAISSLNSTNKGVYGTSPGSTGSITISNPSGKPFAARSNAWEDRDALASAAIANRARASEDNWRNRASGGSDDTSTATSADNHTDPAKPPSSAPTTAAASASDAAKPPAPSKPRGITHVTRDTLFELQLNGRAEVHQKM